MKKHIEYLRKKLEKLNRVIDEKIINGLSYKKEAREHANIRAYLKELNA